MVELYNELRQPIDACTQERRKAVEQDSQEEEADIRNNQFGLAVVGLPNVVSHWNFFRNQSNGTPDFRDG